MLDLVLKVLFAFQYLLPFLLDNKCDDHYFYEVVFETGPMSTHSTKSNVFFILTGEHGHTGARHIKADARYVSDKLYT